MTVQGILQIVLYLTVLLALVKPLGGTWPGFTKAGHAGWITCWGRWSG